MSRKREETNPFFREFVLEICKNIFEIQLDRIGIIGMYLARDLKIPNSNIGYILYYCGNGLMKYRNYKFTNK